MNEGLVKAVYFLVMISINPLKHPFSILALDRNTGPGYNTYS